MSSLNTKQTKGERTAYFTFGQEHRHEIDGVVYDKDCVVKITHPLPRDIMFSRFGRKWCFEYNEPPNMSYFPRGIITLEC